MSERKKPHNGRDLDGHRKVIADDIDELVIDPAGEDILREEIRLSGAVADTGLEAGLRGVRIHELVEENREDVKRIAQA